MYGSSCYLSVYGRKGDSNGLGVRIVLTQNKSALN